jgi:hypothetical protein
VDGPEQLSADENALWFREAGGWQLHQILFWRWDPIDVWSAFPYSVDEYNRYVGQVERALRKGASARVIEELLKGFETELGADPSPDRMQRTREAAEFIVAWYGDAISWWQERR